MSKDEFPSIYTVSCQRELTVQQIRVMQGGEIFCDLSFRRNFHDWEVTEFQRLLGLLHINCNRWPRCIEVGFGE